MSEVKRIEEESIGQGLCPDCHEREFLHLYADGYDSAYVCQKCADRRDHKAEGEERALEAHRQGRD